MAFDEIQSLARTNELKLGSPFQTRPVPRSINVKQKPSVIIIVTCWELPGKSRFAAYLKARRLSLICINCKRRFSFPSKLIPWRLGIRFRSRPFRFLDTSLNRLLNAPSLLPVFCNEWWRLCQYRVLIGTCNSSSSQYLHAWIAHDEYKSCCTWNWR